jgi:hypothetical protein
MGTRVEQLAERRAALQARCAGERRAVERETRAIQDRLGSLDRAATAVRGALLHPAVAAIGLAAVIALSRTRAPQVLARGLLIAASARRLLRVVQRI